MRIALLAPGIRAPWTEGRKNLVRDLQCELERRGYDVVVMPGNSKGGLSTLLSSLRQCWKSLRRSPPDIVVSFPYGRFRGLRGAANILFALVARTQSAILQVPLLTLLYSADGPKLSLLRRLLGPLATVGRRVDRVAFIHLGLGDDLPLWVGSQEQVPKLLFLCGYQEADAHAVRGVLEERGFRLLMEALSEIRMPIRLTVAIPFLRHSTARSALADAASVAGNVDVEWTADADPRATLARHDVFVFPYKGEHEVFVPTSMLEAMAIGVPVVATDLPMYRELTCPDGSPGCFLSNPGDASSLAAQIEQCLGNRKAAGALAQRQRERVQSDWSIERAVDDLLRACGASD